MEETDKATSPLGLGSTEGLGLAEKTPRWWHCDTHGPGNRTAWGCPECVREMRAEIQRLRAELQYARDGLTKGRTRMREDLERHKPLVQAVEWVVEEGRMYPEDLARLRAALDGLRHNAVVTGAGTASG